MSDIEETADVVEHTTASALIEAVPPAEPARAAEPALELSPSSPPSAPRSEALQEPQHTRIGGAAGVRVQHLGAVTTQRASGAGDPLDATSVRVSRSTFDELRRLLAEFPNDELAEQVAALFTAQLLEV